MFLLFLSIFIFTRSLDIHGLEYRDDEIFYFKSTQEMLHTGNVLSPTYFGEDRFQKPILYYWLVLGSYQIFGINWFGARFIAVLFAALSVCCTWLTTKALFDDRRMATLSAVILMTIPLFFRHAKNAVPDMVLNFFIVAALFCAIRFFQSRSDIFQEKWDHSRASTFSVLFFVACALGFMVKGFIALLVPIVTVILYSLFRKKVNLLGQMRFGRGVLIMFLIIAPWFLYMINVHGPAYLDYMLVDETKNRLVSQGGSNIFIKVTATFFDHCLFYGQTIGVYFAPWCIFLLGAIPLSIGKITSRHPASEGLSLMLIWFVTVFCFFSMIYFSISHYMLVLTTPFAILISYFLLEGFDHRAITNKIILFLRKYATVIIFTLGVFVFTFLLVFLAGGSKWWIAVFLLTTIMIVYGIHKSPKHLSAPLSLGLLMLFVYAQSSLLDKAGVTSHAILQKFAHTINQEIKKDEPDDSVIGVGSHDIHEKEFQVYFDQRVAKAAGSMAEETQARLNQLFATDKKVYCLITEKDFEHFLKDSSAGPFEVIQEDYTFRRRMSIDKGFFVAVLKCDQETVHQYLKEKLVLVRRDRNV